MEKEVKNAIRFYLLATMLKYKIRSAWDEKHWNINCDRLESVAEHSYCTSILAIAMNSEFKFNVNMERVLKMIAIHDIGEVLIGDFTPFEKITAEEKSRREVEAVKHIIGDLFDKEELLNLFIEYEKRETPESKLVYMCDKTQLLIEAKELQDMGCQRPLDDQENNVVFRSPAIQKMLEDGAKEPFDIFYKWDEPKFENEPEFKKVLKYINSNNIYYKGDLWKV